MDDITPHLIQLLNSRNQHHKEVYNFYQQETINNGMAQSRVQFFNSESSFGSSSLLSSSRLDFAHEEIVYDTQEIFATLRSFLIPRQDLVDKVQLNHIIHRSRILLKQTIPSHQKNLSKTNNCNQQIACQNCLGQLQNLINNYENYKQSNLSYEQFFKLYGLATKDFYKKIKSSDSHLYQIEPDIVIIESESQKGLKNMQKLLPFESNRASNQNQNKLIQQLNEEINVLKKKEKNLYTQHELELQQMKRSVERRINSILKIYETKNESLIINGIKEQLYKSQQEVANLANKNQQNVKTIQTLQKQIKQLKSQNKMVRDELERNRRLHSSRVSEMGEDDNKSTMSQVDGAHGNQLKRCMKKIKNLQHQIKILQTELNSERLSSYKKGKQIQLDDNKEIARLRRELQIKSKELQQKKLELDREKAYGIKLNDKLENSLKEMELAKFQAVQSPLTPLSQVGLLGNGFGMSDFNRAQDVKGSRYSLSTYIGDGNQFYPYYELLNKEFKIRFKRACLKDKQLLYKANGLQVGVISVFQPPNQLKVQLHLSNFCDQREIRNVKIKVTNAKGNKVEVEKSHIEVLGVGQQIKNMVSLNIRNYPIGCTALICEYEYYGNNEEVRVLLPTHVFKMLDVKPRDDEFRAQSILDLTLERKIAKDFGALLPYFKGAKNNNNKLSSTIFHEHTQTKFLCDIEFQNGNIVIKYEHRSGEETITDYIAKSLSFLLKKDDTI